MGAKKLDFERNEEDKNSKAQLKLVNSRAQGSKPSLLACLSGFCRMFSLAQFHDSVANLDPQYSKIQAHRQVIWGRWL